MRKPESLRGRLNASYHSKQGSMDLVDVNQYNSALRRSHSCYQSVSQFMTRNSKLSPTQQQSRDKNSKSIDSPAKNSKMTFKESSPLITKEGRCIKAAGSQDIRGERQSTGEVVSNEKSPQSVAGGSSAQWQ